jgi:hypothetical protein
MNFHRYKLVVSVTLGNCRSTEAATTESRCIWDSETDASANYTFQNVSILFKSNCVHITRKLTYR